MKKRSLSFLLIAFMAIPMFGQKTYYLPINQDCDKNGLNDSPTKHMGHELVDLGLPSGLKWATMNIGATSETAKGSTFRLGAITSGGQTLLDKNNLPAVIPADMDAASVQWGGKWRMPTREEIIELYTYCNRTTVTSTYKKFESKKDPTKFIYVPIDGTYLYWASTILNNTTNNPQAVHSQNLENAGSTSYSTILSYDRQYYIRPVCE